LLLKKRYGMKKIITILLVCIVVTGSLFAATPFYDKGNQLFSFNVGVTFPTFTHFFNTKETVAGLGEGKTGAVLGGYGGISYQVFNTPYTAIGGEIGYDFNFSVSKELFTAVPFYAKYTYLPLQGKFDIPISAGLGGAYIKYNDASMMTLYMNIETGFIWYPGDHWGIGLHTGLWLIPEFNYFDHLTIDNALAGIIPLTLSISYRQ
jgi:hypothetical protein